MKELAEAPRSVSDASKRNFIESGMAHRKHSQTEAVLKLEVGVFAAEFIPDLVHAKAALPLTWRIS